ncbi:M20 family peptidase [Gemmatimonadota bacterium]
MKRFVQFVLLAFLALAGVVVVRALMLKPDGGSVPDPVTVEVPEGAVDRFAGALRFPTISPADPADFDPEPFLALFSYLEETFPGVHQSLQVERVGDHSVLYTWVGTEPGLAPVLLLAHLDVVPIEPGTEGSWTHPPFSGALADGAVWGRGAMDDKSSLMAILEGAEALVARGFQPRRTHLLAFGHDEEIGGGAGAVRLAALLAERGIRAAYALDEGMAIVEGTLPGVTGPAALLGLAEKGYVSVELVVEVEGGHSSTPPQETAVGILARAVARLEDHPMPARLQGPSRMLLEALAPRMPFGMRLVMGNLWLFQGTVARLMASTPETNAAIRTTTAPTILRAGVKDNILPNQAQAVVNFRILPGDSAAGVLEHVVRTVDDPRVNVSQFGWEATEPSPVSRAGSWGYEEIRMTVQEVFPGTVVAPFLALAATDSRHYVQVAEDVYRFAPFRYRAELAGGVHGTDERIPVEDYLDMVRFYTRLMERSGG